MKANLIRGCFFCHATDVQMTEKKNRRSFHCLSCGKTSFRFFELSGPSKVKKTKDGFVHFSAGALIEKDGKYLIEKRAGYPFLHATLGGHVDKGETFEQALNREVIEETGLNVKDKKLIFKGMISPDPCSRGVDLHDWRLYLVHADGTLRISSESVNLRWLTKKQMARMKFTPPVEYIFKTLRFFSS